MWFEARTVFFARTDPDMLPDRGLGHVVASGTVDTIQVSTVSLDEYARTVPALDFLKCDVEGTEVEVFRGAARVLRKKRPTIPCEMHTDENRRVLLEEFARCSYTCESIDEQHVLALPE